MQRNLVNSILKSSTRKLEMASYPFLMGELNLSREGVHAVLVKKQLKEINSKWKYHARRITKPKAERSKEVKAARRLLLGKQTAPNSPRLNKRFNDKRYAAAYIMASSRLMGEMQDMLAQPASREDGTITQRVSVCCELNAVCAKLLRLA